MIRAYVHKIGLLRDTIDAVDAQLSLQSSEKSGVSSGKSRILDQVSWSRPPSDYCKVNFDGSKLPNGQASFGFVIRDTEGEVLLCGAGALDSSKSILVVEARGLCEGIRGAISLGIGKIVIEGDNLVVVNSIRNIWKIPWTINSIVLDASEDLKHVEDVQIRHAFREANAAADWMAHRCHTTTNTTYWFDVLDFPYVVIICKDALWWPKYWDPL
ncbi:uncharacterized protein LOC125496495 [Beta vulgaris subsp. vulgaris]|uniref:uncharacterized protein LOC125496495 n=1 Tax=Beta vulgaris subsp. vulgaris TaxID=3555 RepID=UPI00203685D4|nr:uncharacterized protein LOC125496495 [Beta vulgaris subsp. vulgaris]